MATTDTTATRFLRILLSAGLAVLLVDDTPLARTSIGRQDHLPLLFFAVIGLRALVDVVEPAARRLVTRRKPPAA